MPLPAHFNAPDPAARPNAKRRRPDEAIEAVQAKARARELARRRVAESRGAWVREVTREGELIVLAWDRAEKNPGITAHYRILGTLGGRAFDVTRDVSELAGALYSKAGMLTLRSNRGESLDPSTAIRAASAMAWAGDAGRIRALYLDLGTPGLWGDEGERPTRLPEFEAGYVDREGWRQSDGLDGVSMWLDAQGHERDYESGADLSEERAYSVSDAPKPAVTLREIDTVSEAHARARAMRHGREQG